MFKWLCSKMLKIKLKMLDLYEQWITRLIFFLWLSRIFFSRLIIKSNWFLCLLSTCFWIVRIIPWLLRILFTCWFACLYLSLCLLTFIIFLWCCLWGLRNFRFRFWCFWRFWFIIIWSWFLRLIFTFCLTIFCFWLVSICFTLSFLRLSFFTLFFLSFIFLCFFLILLLS